MSTITNWFEGLNDLQTLEETDRLWIGRDEAGTFTSYKASLGVLKEFLPTPEDFPQLRTIHSWLDDLPSIATIDPTDRVWITRSELGGPVSYAATLDELITAVEGGVTVEGSLEDLDDTDIVNVQTGEALFRDGTNWVNRLITEADISDLGNYAPQSSLDNHTNQTVAHGTSSNIVGVSDTQTLENKTIDGGFF